VTIGPGASGSAALPQFDSSLGVLRQARVSVSASVSGTWSVENLNNFASWFSGYTGAYVGVLVPVTAPSVSMALNPAFNTDLPVPLAAFDGVVDYAGTSGIVLTFSGASGDGSPSQAQDVYTDSGIAQYVGSGTFAVSFGPFFDVGPNMPPGMQSIETRTAEVRASVRYTYEPFPTRICRAAPFSGCPCNNPSSAFNGCANSVSAAGGALDASGAASLSNDTLVLSGSSMTNSSALYFQGTTFGYVQTPYGDGLRCVAGTLARLGTKTNSAGASQYPAAGDLPISVRGGVGAPGTRFYQVIYRDGGNFCTPSQFNATNGLAIAWVP
jgi:hypothetical protein